MSKFYLFASILFTLSLEVFAQSYGDGCGYEPRDVRFSAGAVSLDKLKIQPSVINYNATGNVIFEAYVTGTASKLTLRVGTNGFDFNDSGVNGDKKAGDNIFTLSFPASAILSRLTDLDVYRPFLGYLEVYEGGVKITQANVFPCVRTLEMPDVPITKKTTGIQSTSRVVNIVGPNGDGNNYTSYAKTFYSYYPDIFDFIHFVHVPGYYGNRYHSSVQNSVVGTGQQIYNSTSTYGSKGKLQGFNAFPLLSFYDGASNAYIHEIGHQWINFLQNTEFKPGIPHWPASSTASGIMGISIGGAGGAGGTFTKKLIPQNGGYLLSQDTEPTSFNHWELYLMGLIPKTDIQDPALIFKNQTVFPNNGFFVSSDFTQYTINQLVNTVGDRIPNSAISQKNFRIATIALSDDLLSPVEMAYLHFMTGRAELKEIVNTGDGFSKLKSKPFFVATGGRATLQTSLEQVSSTLDEKSITIQVFPNPFEQNIVIRFDDPLPMITTLDIKDLHGKIVQKIEIPKGESSIKVSTEFLIKGIYVLTMRDNFTTRGTKLIKI